jgi:hypothetical protein
MTPRRLQALVALLVTPALACSLVARGASRPDEDSSSTPPEASQGRRFVPDRNDRQRLAGRPAYLRRACALPPDWVRRIDRGWRRGPARAADIIVVPKPPNYVGSWVDTSHSGPYDYLQEVPLVFYGPGFIKPWGRWTPAREVTVADIAPTQAELMGFGWPERQGRPLEPLLEDSPEPPRVIVTVSIDGGGWNVLRRWPGAWPRLAMLMRRGTSVEPAVVGSSPSITPAIHATMSTGAWPRHHGVTAIAVRGRGGVIQGAFTTSPNATRPPVEPTLNLRLTTLGDLWDRAVGNRAEVGMLAGGNYALGMLGRGAALKGGDKDLAGFAQLDGRGWETDTRFYRLPRHVASHSRILAQQVSSLDRSDGRADGAWLGHDLAGIPVSNTPAMAVYEGRVAEGVLAREGYGRDALTDLLYLHFKSPDHTGHRWNMISPEMRDVLGSVDRAIGSLWRWLDRNVGVGNYVLVVTADHGQTPLEAGGWAIDRDELLADLDARFDYVKDGESIIERTSATSLFSNTSEMRANGITPADVASRLGGYTIRDNVPRGDSIPKQFAGRVGREIYAAAFPGRRLPLIRSCTLDR